MLNRKIQQLTTTLSVAALLSACAMGPDYRRPDVALTPRFRNAALLAESDTAANSAAADWWSGFNDPELTWIIRATLAQNLDVAQAATRVEQARAAAAYAGAALLPQGNVQTSASRTEDSLNSAIGEVVHAVDGPRAYDSYSVSAQASWEIDLFGGLRRQREAARAEAQAAAVDQAAVRISMAAEAADAYIRLRGLQAQLALAESQEKIETHLTDLIRRRVGQGVSANRELQRAVGELERVRATMPPLRAAMDAELDRLDVLMGTQASTHRSELLGTFTMQPAAPALAGGASPSDLLRRRPDIVVAERRLAAANASIGAAVAEYYPHLSLSAALGLDTLSTGSLLKSSSFEGLGAAGLRWRLFDFGRVDAQVAAARGREAEMLAAYRSTVLRATEDVENALSLLLHSREALRILQRQITALSLARDQTELAYEGGVVPLIDVLDADRELLAAQDRLATARADEARAAVESFRALGGGWTS